MFVTDNFCTNVCTISAIFAYEIDGGSDGFRFIRRANNVIVVLNFMLI